MDGRSRAKAGAAHFRGGWGRTNGSGDGRGPGRADPPGPEQGLPRPGPRPRAGGASGGGGFSARHVRGAAARSCPPVTGEERSRSPVEGQGRGRGPGSILLVDGHEVPASTVIWTAG